MTRRRADYQRYRGFTFLLPFRGHCQAKKILYQKFFDFFLFMSCRRSLQYRFFLKMWRQSSLRQTPIRIEATPRDPLPKEGPSAHCGPEKLRLRAGSISYRTIPMVLMHQSYRAPGPGSKDASNSYFDRCDSVPI